MYCMQGISSKHSIVYLSIGANRLKHHPPVTVHAQHGATAILDPGRVDVIIAPKFFEKLGMIIYRYFTPSEPFDTCTVGWSEEGSETVARGYGGSQRVRGGCCYRCWCS